MIAHLRPPHRDPAAGAAGAEPIAPPPRATAPCQAHATLHTLARPGDGTGGPGGGGRSVRGRRCGPNSRPWSTRSPIASGSRSRPANRPRSPRNWPHDMVGYGPLEPLLPDDSISDIMVNGPNDVFVERRGKLRADRASASATPRNLPRSRRRWRRGRPPGRRISPLVDCRLADGSRVNVVFPPLAIDGACISIRKFAKQRDGFCRRMVGERHRMSPAMARVLEIAARCRLNIVISGGTGSGKTTMLNAMSRLIDHGERIVTIEDAAELQLQQPHVVRLETRPVEPRGPRRDHPARPDQERAADAARPHHRRRGARRRGLRHAAGDEHRP